MTHRKLGLSNSKIHRNIRLFEYDFGKNMFTVSGGGLSDEKMFIRERSCLLKMRSTWEENKHQKATL